MKVKPGDRILILGGAGFVGRALIVRLHAAGYRLRVATRHPERHRDLLVLPQLELWAGDVHDDTGLRAALAGCQAVVNLVGILNESRRGDFGRVHEALPARCARLGAPRIVHISALGADPAADSRYLASKGRGEISLRAAAPAAILLRPSLIYGRRDHFVCRFRKLSRWLPLLLLPVPTARLAPVAVTDVAAAIEQALTDPHCDGQTYALCGPRSFSFLALVRLIVGNPRRVWPLPAPLGALLGRLGDVFSGQPFSSEQLRMLAAGSVCTGAEPGLESLHIIPADFETVLTADLRVPDAC
ncbi:MAG: complex I NDUFA9 subunit family protein [Gammaproteobacteria bacterium]|nr:complex I NDUFA9 subunit family protein [Gammaproteobacteria bacterium]